MKKLFFIFITLFCATMAKAEYVIDVDMTDACKHFVSKNALNAGDIMLNGSDIMESDMVNNDLTAQNPAVEIEGVKTYKNWLGEECIDFGDAPKLYYNWKRDVTYVGIPLFISSFIIKSQKRAFRSARFAMDENWKSKVDDYSQFFPYLPVVGLKALGYNGRSSWDRLIVSAGLSNAVMATIVNATKYSVKEMRPDNSQANSFPSGHTATAFTAASILHKEYGLTRSPWFSVGGYAVAMGTGFMRVLNNRHWISDVVAGAGIGMLSTELGYFLTDLLYKNNGITRKELVNITNPNHPSFFDIQLGIGMHKSTMTADWDDGSESSKFELGTSSMVGVEGAYFINKYLGVGGIARVTTTPVKGLGLTDEESGLFQKINNGFTEDGEYYPGLEDLALPGIYNIKTSNSNMIDGSFDVGVYGNLPLSSRFSLGAKALFGVRVNGGYEYKATAGFRTFATDANGNNIVTYNGKEYEPVYVFENADGSTFLSNEMLQPNVSTSNNFHLNKEQFDGNEYTLCKLTGKSNFNYVLGLSLRYNYKNNFAWKVFVDFDSSKNKYNWNFNFFDDATLSKMEDYAIKKIYDGDAQKYQESPQKVIIDEMKNNEGGAYKMKASFKSLYNLFTIGAAFSISF